MNGRASYAAVMAAMLGYVAPVLGKQRKDYTVETGPKLCGDRELDNTVPEKSSRKKSCFKEKEN